MFQGGGGLDGVLSPSYGTAGGRTPQRWRAALRSFPPTAVTAAVP